MIRVAPYDANFAYTESGRVRQSIATAYAFEESTAPTSELVEWLATRAATLPTLRQRMVRAYGDIGDAYWSESPAFDPREHITVTPSATWEEMRSRLAHAHEPPFDYSLPLWSAEIIRQVTGIAAADGRACVVVLFRFHHGMTDGMGAAALARMLFSRDVADITPTRRSVSRSAVTAVESARLLIRPFLVAADAWRLMSIARQMSKDRADGLWSLPDFGPRMTAVNQTWSGNAHADVAFFSGADLRRAAQRAGGASVNDVVLAAIGGATAMHLDEEHLVAAVPVSVREIPSGARNAAAIALVNLRPDLEGSERVAAIHANVKRERNRFQLSSFSAMYEGNPLPRLPGFAYRWLAAIVRRSAQQPKPVLTQLKVSTVPRGSADGWLFAGSPVVATFGVPPLADRLGLNHSVSRIGDVVAIGVIADPEQLADLENWMRCLHAEVTALTGPG